MTPLTQSPPSLRRMAQVEPPAHLWSRILATRLSQERRRHRSLLLIGGLANAAALALLAGAWFFGRSPAAVQESVETLIARSQVLEERLLAYENRFAGLQSTQRELAEQQQAQLIALDQRLAEAYAQGQPVAQLNDLWRRRAGLVSSLLGLYEAPQAKPEES